MKRVIISLLPLLLLVAPPFAAAFICSVSTTSLSFGGYDVIASAQNNSTGSINVSCNNSDRRTVVVNIAISSGIARGFNPRQMLGFRDRLNYNLYTDPARSTVWGDGSGGTSTVTTATNGGAGVTTYIYGVIPARQNVSAGPYFDTLIVTLTW